MKRADASGAEFAVIIGEAEAAADVAAVKALRATDPSVPFAQQRPVPLATLGETLAAALADEDNATLSGND